MSELLILDLEVQTINERIFFKNKTLNPRTYRDKRVKVAKIKNQRGYQQ